MMCCTIVRDVLTIVHDVLTTVHDVLYNSAWFQREFTGSDTGGYYVSGLPTGSEIGQWGRKHVSCTCTVQLFISTDVAAKPTSAYLKIVEIFFYISVCFLPSLIRYRQVECWWCVNLEFIVRKMNTI